MINPYESPQSVDPSIPLYWSVWLYFLRFWAVVMYCLVHMFWAGSLVSLFCYLVGIVYVSIINIYMGHWPWHSLYPEYFAISLIAFFVGVCLLAISTCSCFVLKSILWEHDPDFNQHSRLYKWLDDID